MHGGLCICNLHANECKAAAHNIMLRDVRAAVTCVDSSQQQAAYWLLVQSCVPKEGFAQLL